MGRITVVASIDPAIPEITERKDSSVEEPLALGDRPRFIEMDVWKRAHYYSCTRKAVECLKRRFDKPIGLLELAEVACMEKTTFSKAFRQKTGITLHEFIQAYRVSQAASKMETSDYSITEIAFSTGFGSLDTFGRVFKKVARSTPSQYRLEIRRRNGLMPELPIKVAS
jgi:transcriptional regulator GlxA family with amidase domain